jgi:hypothetical protein
MQTPHFLSSKIFRKEVKIMKKRGQKNLSDSALLKNRQFGLSSNPNTWGWNKSGFQDPKVQVFPLLFTAQWQKKL